MQYCFLDTETSGLPTRTTFSKMPHYLLLNNYNTSRLVQMYLIITDENFNIKNQYNFIIKVDFPIENSEFHGITNEISNDYGISIHDLADKLKEILSNVSCIFIHNADFDINILKSELFRIKKTDVIKIINQIKVFCTMINTKDIVGLKNNKKQIKFPKLAELYYYLFNRELVNAHNCEADTTQLFEIVCELNKKGLIKI